MSVRYMGQNAGPNFQESPERVQNNNNSDNIRYRIVKRVRRGNVSHPSTLHFTTLNLPKSAGNVTTNCEVFGKWQT